MFRDLIIIFSAVLISINSFASEVKGRLIDKDTKEGIINGAVYFATESNTSSNLVALTDLDGRFSLDVPEGEYNVTLAFQEEIIPLRKNIIIDSDIDFETIEVDLSIFRLDAAVAVSSRPMVKYEGGKVLYDLSALPAVAGGNALDGLLSIPGITSDGQTSLKINGFVTPQIRVNGRNLRLSDEETMNFISNMKISAVDHVEYIKNPGPQYESEGKPVLDIVMRHIEDVFEGAASASLTYQKLFSESGAVRIDLNKGISSNYIYYRFGQNRSETVNSLDVMTPEISRVDPSNNHRAWLGSDLRFSAYETAGYRVSVGLQDSEQSTNNGYFSGYHRKSLTGYLYNSFKKDKFSWDIDALFSSDNGDRNINIDNRLEAHETDYLNFRVSTLGSVALSESSSISLGGSIMIPEVKNNVEGSSVLASKYSERASSVYVTYRYTRSALNLETTLMFNDVYEDLLLNGSDFDLPESGVSRLLPSLSLTYDLSKNHRVGLDYKSKVLRPNYRDIIPASSSSSSILVRDGNTALKSGWNSELDLSYSFMKAAYAELSYSMTKKPIMEYIYPDSDRYVMKMLNMDSSDYLRFVVSIPVPIINMPAIGLRWITFTNFAWHRQWDKGTLPGDMDYRKVFNAYYFLHKHTFSFPGDWSADCQAVYYSPLYSGLYKTATQWWIALNVRKKMKSVSVSLGLHDPFNTNVAKVTLGPSLDNVYTIDWQAPRFTLGLTWHFGKSLSKKAVNRRVDNGESRLDISDTDNITIGL